MEFPKSLNVRVAAKDYSQHNLSKTHITTQDFGFLKGLECKLMVPGDKFRVNVRQKTQLLTMPAPTYGKIDMILRAFFVPINTIWHGFHDFIANNKVTSSATSLSSAVAPFVYIGDIASRFVNPSSDPHYVVAGTSEDYDITVYDLNYTFENGSWSANHHRVTRKFTYFGRKFYDFLFSIGLKFPMFSFSAVTYSGVSYQSLGDLPSDVLESLKSFVASSSDSEERLAFNYASKKVSLLPLLAFWKFYIDWIVPSRFLSNYVHIRYVLDRFYSGGSIAYSDILAIFEQVPYSFLEDDYFTTLFQNAYGYEDTANVADSMVLPNAAGSDYNPAEVHPVGAESPHVRVDFSTDINMFSLKSLGALQDMLNRGKIAGSKAKDYLFTTYGIRPSDDALHISTYLGSSRIPITFDSLESTSDTYDASNGDGALLGQKVGVGVVGSDGFQFSYDCKGEHGFLFITSELQTKTSYTQGLAPEFDLLDRFDFFEPSLDALGVEAVPASMLLNSWDTLDDNSVLSSPDQIFGYSPRYSKYKVNFDNISGDFLIRSLNTGLDSWHLSRIFKPADLLNFPMINEEFCRAVGDTVSGSYDRIFSVDNNSIDHFYSIFHIDIEADRKMKSLKDSLEFEDGGKSVEVSVNGSVQS